MSVEQNKLEFVNELVTGSAASVLNSGELTGKLNCVQENDDVIVTNRKGKVIAVLFAGQPVLHSEGAVEIVVKPSDLI